jgi:hypothetical protein
VHNDVGAIVVMGPNLFRVGQSDDGDTNAQIDQNSSQVQAFTEAFFYNQSKNNTRRTRRVALAERGSYLKDDPI